MPFSFTVVYKEALANAPHNVTMVDAITIDHPTFGSPLRLCLSDKDLILDGNLFIGTQFQFSAPELKANSSGGIEITIADIELLITKFLDAVLETTVPMTTLYESFLSTEVEAQAQFDATLEATNVEIRNRTLSLTATYPDLVRKKVPAVNYTTNEWPGLR